MLTQDKRQSSLRGDRYNVPTVTFLVAQEAFLTGNEHDKGMKKVALGLDVWELPLFLMFGEDELVKKASLLKCL